MSNPAETPEIRQAYDDVRSDRTETDWLLINYEDAKSDRLVLKATGSGGLAELKQHLDPAEAHVRMTYFNDTESQRVKFAMVIWIGEGCKVMRKAKVSIQSGNVRKVLAHHAITVDARELADLEEADLVVRLRKAGGADYNNQTRS